MDEFEPILGNGPVWEEAPAAVPRDHHPTHDSTVFSPVDDTLMETYPLPQASLIAPLQRFAQQSYQRVRVLLGSRRCMVVFALVGLLLSCSGLGITWLVLPHHHGSQNSGNLAQLPTATTLADVSPTPTFPIYVAGSPTPQGTGYATATPHPGNQPTVTPTTTPPTPTATPDPHAGSAAITFTRSQQTLTPSATVTACDGCAIDPSAATVPSIYVADSVADVYGHFTASSKTSYTTGDPRLTFNCASGASCVLSQYFELAPTSGSVSCRLDVTIRWSGTTSANCTLTQTGYHCVSYYGQVPSVAAIHVTTGSGCYGATIITYYAPSTCMSYGNNGADVQANAKSLVLNYVNTHGLAGNLAGPTVTFPTQYYCSDSRGVKVAPGGQLASYTGSYFYQRQDATGYRYTFTPTDASSLQQQRISAIVPSGYSLDGSSMQVCSAPTVLSVDLASKHAQLSCSASGRAYYVWTPTLLRSLAEQIAGKSVSQAQAILAQTTGISGGIAISVANGKSYLPTDPDAISFTVNN